jgi:hypothetical protein
MSNSMTSRSGIKSPTVLIVLGATIAASTAMTASLADEDVDASQSLRLTYSVQVTSKTTPTSDPTCPLKVVISGAGLTNLLGPVHDEQSDCVQLDLTVDHGVFTFTGAALGGPPGGTDSGDSITARYRAHMVPTARSILPTATTPPGGFWLIYGQVCIWKGTGKFANIINDCPVLGSPGRFSPARGTLDFDTGQANVFGFNVVRLSEPLMD